MLQTWSFGLLKTSFLIDTMMSKRNSGWHEADSTQRSMVGALMQGEVKCKSLAVWARVLRIVAESVVFSYRNFAAAGSTIGKSSPSFIQLSLLLLICHM
jgi:hypothetical protein